MGLLDRLAGFLGYRADSAPRLDTVDPTTAGATIGGSIANYFTGLGTVGDKGVAARPNLGRVRLEYAELSQLWRFNGYARRYVELIPEEACRKGWCLQDESAESEPLADEARELQLTARVQEAFTWARLYGGAVILLVTEDDVPPQYRLASGAVAPQWLQQPLDTDRVKAVRNLVVCDYMEARPIEYEGRISSPHFREPSLWQIQPRTAGYSTDGAVGLVVHSSRLVYLPGVMLPPMLRYAQGGYDDSVLQSTWDAIRNKTTIDQAGAVLASEIKINVLKISGLAALNTSDQADAFNLRMRIMAQTQSVNNMVMIDEGETYENQSVNLAGWKDLDAQAKDTLCAVTGLPMVVLFGEAPGGLSTDGDSHRRLMANLIASVQEHRLKGPLTEIYRVMLHARANSGGDPVPEQWSVEFHPLDELTEAETAALRKTHAETDVINITSGVLTANEVRASRYGEEGYQSEILPVVVEEDVGFANMPPPEPEPENGGNAPVPAK